MEQSCLTHFSHRLWFFYFSFIFFLLLLWITHTFVTIPLYTYTQIVDKQLNYLSPLIKSGTDKVSHFTLIPLDNYKTRKTRRSARRRVFLLLYFSFATGSPDSVVFQPLIQVSIHLLPVGLVKDLMPVAGVQPQRHIPDPRAPVLLVDLPDAFPEISHRIVRT